MKFTRFGAKAVVAAVESMALVWQWRLGALAEPRIATDTMWGRYRRGAAATRALCGVSHP
jgi:hypothetical protein